MLAKFFYSVMIVSIFTALTSNLYASDNNDSSETDNDKPCIESLTSRLNQINSQIPRVSGFFQNRRGEVYPIEVTPTLISELSAFADPDSSKNLSGLPSEINPMGLGQELRLYFENNHRRVRLTVRRLRSGGWSFGTTVYDRKFVDENFRDPYAPATEDARYTLNERMWLEMGANPSHLILPEDSLKNMLRMIHSVFSADGVLDLFENEQAKWAKAIPENARGNSEVDRLFLSDLGQKYYLDRGFVSEQQSTLNESEKQVLAAIHYLIDHNLVYWSCNAGSSGIKEGIYPIQGPGSVKTPTLFWMMGYDFGNSLIQAMEKADLIYLNGRWTAHYQE